jgi:putative flippase GtrA
VAQKPERLIGRQALRFALAGAVVMLTYVGLTLLLSGVAGIPIQVAIAVAYVLAVMLHFALQRTFVFRHELGFALTTGSQVRRYVVIGVVQYTVTAATTTALPTVLGASEQVVYVATVLVISACTFLFLRHRVFHPA